MSAASNPNTQPDGDPMRSIAQVESETRLPRATLRIWERRYGFPAPARDARGERSYPPDQVELLRLVRRLMDQGLRPGALLAGGPEGILKLAGGLERVAAEPRPRGSVRLLKLLREHDAAGVQGELVDMLDRVGLGAFAGELMPQLNRMIGEAWHEGTLQIHEEHLYSDCVSQLLRSAIAGLSAQVRPEAPQVLLTTFPQESHGLGLLMAQAHFALQGCPTLSLGVCLPVPQIAAGAKAHGADLVGLSFTASPYPIHVLRGLEELRALLPAGIRIWAGGDCPALRRRSIAGVRVVDDVRHIGAWLAEDFALPPRN